MRLIGLTGHMGAGKDAAAALLSMIGYQRIAFADQVRLEVAKLIQSRDFPEVLLNSPIAGDLIRATTAEVWQKPTSAHMRRILQYYGSEYRRSQDPDYWVHAGISSADTLPLAVVTDVRFPNEVEAVKARGGVICRIEREVEVTGLPDHISERIEHIEADHVIANDGTLLDLAAKLRDWVNGAHLPDATGTP